MNELVCVLGLTKGYIFGSAISYRELAQKSSFKRHLSLSPVLNLGKTTRLPQIDLTPWTLTLGIPLAYPLLICLVITYAKLKQLLKENLGYPNVRFSATYHSMQVLKASFGQL